MFNMKGTEKEREDAFKKFMKDKLKITSWEHLPKKFIHPQKNKDGSLSSVMIAQYTDIETRKLTSLPWKKTEFKIDDTTIPWRIEVPKVTDDRMKVFIGTLKAVAKVIEDSGRNNKDVTKNYETREILYKGDCICKQAEWTGDWTWIEKRYEDQTKMQYEKDEKERATAAKKKKP